MERSPACLGAAYCALANGGRRVQPHAIRSIEDGDGHVIYRAPQEELQAVSAETAYMITDMLKTAASSGSAKALSACGVPVAGKTGTVAEGDDGTRDIWTVAYTPEMAVTVWMGYDAPGAEHRLPPSEGGSGYPARLCADFIGEVSDELSSADFDRPSGVRTALLDALALEEDKQALLSTEKTPAGYTVRELFRAGGMPVAFSENWIAPSAVSDFELLTGPGEMPVLSFTALERGTEYAITRTVNGVSAEIGALRGEPGENLRFADDTLDLSQPAEYTLLPRNSLLYEEGELLAGPVSGPARYTPGGLLNTIMGVGKPEATSTPAEIECEPDQSLFS